MKWKGRKGSSNIEDRRGRGGRGRKRAVRGGIGTTIIIIILALIFGQDPMALLSQVEGGTAPTGQYRSTPANDEAARFVGVVLKETEDVWNELFRQMGKSYKEPTLVLFEGRVQSACGFQSAAVGPFYCPADQKIYIDLAFFTELKKRFGAPGDFAQAYVIAHEVGHHVQNLLGISSKVHQQRSRVSKKEGNKLSVKQELQADFLAGVWAHHTQRTKGILEAGDIEEALRAAHVIGDDHIQKKAQGYIVPDGFTHGTSAQRMKWFKLGYETGDLNRGNTFEMVR